MSPEVDKLHAVNRDQAEQATAQGLSAWKKSRRCTWSRTDTARWLNERSPAVLAWLRRTPGKWPERSKQVGYCLKDYHPRVFDRAHATLLRAPSDDARETLLPHEVIQ